MCTVCSHQDLRMQGGVERVRGNVVGAELANF